MVTYLLFSSQHTSAVGRTLMPSGMMTQAAYLAEAAPASRELKEREQDGSRRHVGRLIKHVHFLLSHRSHQQDDDERGN